MPPYPGFCGPSYISQSPISSCEETINWFTEVIEVDGAKNSYALYPTPGITEFGSTSLSPGRGIFYEDGRMFAVIGFAFVEVDSTGTITVRGTVDSDGNPATISSSGEGGNQLFITSGGNGYIYDLLTDTLTQVVGLQATVGGFLSGFFIALDTVNSTVRISNYFDGLTWDPTQFRVRGLASDKWVSMAIIQSNIWLFGSKTYEVWQNTGQAPFPFFPIPGYFFSEGIGARFSLASLGDFPAWLSLSGQGEGQVFMADQYAPKRISNHAIEYAIQNFIRGGGDVSDAIGFAYQQDGHNFFCLTFPSWDETLCFDRSTNQWHKRRTWVNDGIGPARWEAWRPLYHAYAFNKHLVLDRRRGKIYEMGPHLYSDVGGSAIRRVRVPPILFSEMNRVYINRIELDMQVGIGLTSGQGSNPLMMMRSSNDGGFTYGNEHQASAGPIGKYNTYVYWNRQGQSRGRRTYEFSTSDPVPWRLTNCYVTLRNVRQGKR